MEKKIGILTSAYKRPHISKAFCLMIDRLLRDYPDLFLPVCIASLEEDRALFEKHHIETYIHQNRPLAGKWNLGLSKFRGRVSHVMVIDSDDIVNNNYINQLLANSDNDLVWCRGVYILCAEKNGFKGSVRFWDAPYKTFGATAMLISGKLLDKTDWKIYKGTEDDMMGYSSHEFLLPHITTEYKFQLRETGSILLDIKSEESINSFKDFIGSGMEVDFNTMLSMVSEKEADYLKLLVI
jgi:hypothetical protein